MSLAAVLANAPGRCAYGFSIEHHHPQWCACEEGSEWAVFVAALKQAKQPDGTVSQTDVRPLIKGRIKPPHVGPLYQRAVREHLIKRIGYERGTDVAGRNAHHEQGLFRWI